MVIIKGYNKIVFPRMDDPIDAYEVDGIIYDGDVKIESDDNCDYESDNMKSDRDTEDNSDIDEPNKKRKRTRRQPQFIVKFNGWKCEEKRNLYNALKENGSADITYLANRVRTKTPKAIRECIANYERHARSSLKLGKGRAKTERKAPIDKWLDYMIKSSTSESFKHMDIARALKYIALFESKSESADINIGDCYEVLSNLFRGDAPKLLNQYNSIFLLKNIQKLASLTKDVNHDKEKEFFNTRPQETVPKIYRNKKKSGAVIEQIINHDDVFNPLKIPKHLLLTLCTTMK